MKNFTNSNIQNLKDFISNTITVFDDGISWANLNLKYDEKNEVILKIKNAKNTFNKINNGINDKPVIAVFGASQVGKSYLIKNLLSSDDKTLEIINKNNQYDFLKEINPAGTGAESTGLVTRFTVDQNDKFEDFPIQVKLLSAKDILIIILDTYFLDLKKITVPYNIIDLEKSLIEFENNYTDEIQSHLNEFDVLEIKNYLEKHLDKYSLLFEPLNSIRFFERVAAVINGYSYESWIEIFKVLWNNSEHLNKLLNNLLSNLNHVNFEAEAYLKFEEILREYGAILDVKRLKEMYDSTKTITIKLSNGSEVDIMLSVIAALTKELILTLPKELLDEKAFLKNSDLLDFPGARSRLGLEYEGISTEIIPDMFLRGKVSYLFNKYSDEFSINNLLFCTNDKQLDVTEIPSLLENWISRNIGSSIHQRTETLSEIEVPPLFIVYTFFNNQLKYDTTNDINFRENLNSLDYKWNTRFNRFFKNEIVTQNRDWDTNWTLNKRTFNNMYILRDFKYSTDTHEGYELNGKELKLKEEREVFLSQLKKSFVSFDFVQKHFQNPEEIWNQTTEINKNGSHLIVENLNEVSNNFSKINYYINKIKEIVLDLKVNLELYAHNDNIETARKAKMQNINTFQFSFNQLLAKDKNAFNKFLNLLIVKPERIFNLLNENIVVDVSDDSVNQIDENNILISTYPSLKNVKSIDEAFEVLKQELWLSTTLEVEEFLSSKGIDKTKLFNYQKPKSKSEYYSSLIFKEWKEQLNENSRYAYFTSNEISMSSISFIIDQLLEIVSTRKVIEHLTKITNDVISEIDTNHGVEEFLSESSALIINDIINHFDVYYLGEETKVELANMPNFHTFRSFVSLKEKPSNDIEQIFDQDKNKDIHAVILEKYKAWIEFLRISVLVNSGFANYDTVANANLIGIIEGLNEFNFKN